MIAKLFEQLFGFLGDILGALLNFFADTFGNLFNIIWSAIKWLGRQIGNFFQSLIDVLLAFFKVIYELIEGILYLLYMIGVLAVKLFLVIFEAAKVLWSLIVGFGKTLASFTYNPVSNGSHGYSTTIGKIFGMLDSLQLDVVAYILLFLIWFTTAIGSMKLISSIRVGGD